MKDTTATTESVVIECDLPDPPEKVWRALTEQGLLGAWLMPNDMRPEVGAQFRFRPGSGEGAAVECEILAAEPHRILRWRQSERHGSDAEPRSVDSVVSFELSRTPTGGTHLRLVHDGFESCSSPVVERSVLNKTCAVVVQLQPRRLRAHSQRNKTLPGARFLAHLRTAA
jgi:uncharacterized protein YndB with AHSA1/START domain